MTGPKRIAVFAAFLCCCTLAANVAPGSTAVESRAGAAGVERLGDRFGAASSHLKLYADADKEAELDAMEEAGIGWIRCDFAWSDLEPESGSWNLEGADAAVAVAEQHGVKILGILGTSPPWANGGKDWRHPPSDMEAWRHYVRTVAARYKGRVPAWEIWNEENIHAFWQPEPDPGVYVPLLAAASEEIRDVDPGATVVMGGVAGLDPDYLDACLALGAAEHIDAIAYHPYAETIGMEGQPEEDTFRPKESLCRFIVDFVHWLVSQYTARDIQVWITEFGWTTCEESPPGVDERAQASYMLRSLINYAGLDVERVIWFNLRDTHLNERDYYGLLDSSFAPKYSYRYYATFEEVFGEAAAADESSVSFSCSNQATLEAHFFETAGGKLAMAFWKSDDAADGLDMALDDLTLRSIYRVDPLTGERWPVSGLYRDREGRLAARGLPLGKDPLILEADTEPPPSSTFYFAEGYTGAGFQEYLCLGNTGVEDASAAVRFLFEDGSTQQLELDVPGASRATLDVNGVVGPGRCVSAEVISAAGEIVAERPMYFSYGPGWEGGHCVKGAVLPSKTHYFAEGYTGDGFDEWICVLNPGDAPADLTFSFQTQEEGEKVVPDRRVGPRSRASFKVSDLLGRGYQCSCRVDSDRPIIAERPMYFEYRGRGGHAWRGGHCVMGSAVLSREYYLAEGTTRAGFEEWITLQNPHDKAIEVTAVFQTGQGQGQGATRAYRVEAGSRLTVFVEDELGVGRDTSTHLSCRDLFLVERPMYFDYRCGDLAVQGGHCVIGVDSPAGEWRFAEGYTGEGFQQWLCLQNPGGAAADVRITYRTGEEGALPPREVTLPAMSRTTLLVNEHAGTGCQLSTGVEVLSGPEVVVERPMYFDYGPGWGGGHAVTGFAR